MTKRSKRSPSAMSKSYMEDCGYHVETVERWIPGANIRKDLFGFGDLLCVPIKHALTLHKPAIIQCTSASNFSARVKKVNDSELIGIVLEHFDVWVHGWKSDGSLRSEKIL